MNKSLKGNIYVLISAICFALGGILIKLIPWSALSIQGARSAFSLLVIIGYMALKKRKFVFNKSVIFGGISIFVMALTFVAATKLTTAANAIVLQFTEPIFVILLMWIIYKKKPGKDAVFTSIAVFAGILCFFFESLGGGGTLGNILAIISGFAYAWVFMIKQFPEADFESSLILSNVMSILVGIPFYGKETEGSLAIWICVIFLGIFQCGFSYVFLSWGLDYVSPIAASLTSTIEPVLNPILVAMFYGEKIGAVAVIGALLVVGSATVYSVLQAKQDTGTEETNKK